MSQGSERDGNMVIAYPQSGDPTNLMAVIEIPAGSFTKYEMDTVTGHLVVHRFQSMPIVYPANYGSIPGTIGGDGEALDVLVLTREPIYPGALIRVRPIGVLKMIDGGVRDDKIIAVPVSAIDPTYDDVKSIEDLAGSSAAGSSNSTRCTNDSPSAARGQAGGLRRSKRRHRSGQDGIG